MARKKAAGVWRWNRYATRTDEQERARLTAKQESRIERTGQTELFAAASVPGGPPLFDEERAMQQGAALQRLRGLLQANRVVPYDQALAALLARDTPRVGQRRDRRQLA